MADQEKLRLEISDLNGEADAETMLGRAYTVALANDGLDAEAIKAEALDGDYSHLLETLGKYFELV